MKLRRAFICGIAGVVLVGGKLFAADSNPTNPSVTTPPVYVSDYTHANGPLPDGVIAWDDLTQTADATNGQDFARFTFNFTNATAGNVTILSVHPGCGCTTAKLPPMPWTISAGSNGAIQASVNLAGKSGTLFLNVTVTTDKGWKELMLRINIRPPFVVNLTEEQRAADLAAAKVDRQAVFKGDCASCHLKNVRVKSGQSLFTAVCSVCHEAENRATMVPDLAALKIPTNREFWRTWITFGKPGSLMPAFASDQGGPLNYQQITSLAVYLNAVHPSHVPPAPQ